MMRRLDRLVIFVFIAGIYTPFAAKLMGNAWGIPLCQWWMDWQEFAFSSR